MELNARNIEEYVNRFLEGETTNAEEQALYRFFHKGDVPAHLREYIPMFAWYEGGMQGEPGEQPVTAPVVLRPSWFRRIPMTIWSAGVVAMLVVSVGLGVLLCTENSDLADDWTCYEGSYVEVGGKRITDVKQIMPCILQTLEQAEHVEQLAQERMDAIRRSENEIREKELLGEEIN